jgi:hypothetical protein
MSAQGVVPSLDEAEDGVPCVSLLVEFPSVEELALEGGKEAFAHGVVVGVADGTKRGSNAHLAATLIVL